MFSAPLGSVSDEKLGGPAVFQSLRHHERPFRRRVCILVSVFVFYYLKFNCCLFLNDRYVKDRMSLGTVFGSRDMWSGLAVIADTFR